MRGYRLFFEHHTSFVVYKAIPPLKQLTLRSICAILFLVISWIPQNALLAADYLYAVYEDETRIERFDLQGNRRIFADTKAFLEPYAANPDVPKFLAVDLSGNLWVSTRYGAILRFSPNGVGSLVFPEGTARVPTLDQAGFLYFTDNDGNRVLRLGQNGVLEEHMNLSGFLDGLGAIQQMVFAPDGSLYFTIQDVVMGFYSYNQGKREIYKRDPNGVITIFATQGIVGPWGMARMSSGDLLVGNTDEPDDLGNSDPYAAKLMKISPAGISSVFASRWSWVWSGTTFGDAPASIAVRSNGEIFVLSGFSGDIWKFSPDGNGFVWAQSGIFDWGGALGAGGSIAIGPGLSHKVTGRVVDGTSNNPITNATAALVSKISSSNTQGEFELGGIAEEGPVEIEITAPGYASKRVQTHVKANQVNLDLGQIVLYPGGFRVESISLDPEALSFLQGWEVEFVAKAKIDWDNLTPERVEFSANDKVVGVATEPGDSGDYEATFYVDEHFVASLAEGANKITVVATGLAPNQQARSTPPFEKELHVFALPAALKEYAPEALRTKTGTTLSLSFSFPKTPPQGRIDLPVFGGMAGKVKGSLEFRYGLKTGEYTLTAGASQSKPYGFEHEVGDRQMNGEINGMLKGVASSSGGINLNGGEISARFGVRGKFHLGDYSPLSLLGTQASSFSRSIRDLLSYVSIGIYYEPSLSGETSIGVNSGERRLSIKALQLSGTAGIKAMYSPSIPKGKLELYVGGSASPSFGLPEPFFRGLNIKSYIGAKVSLWTLVAKGEHVFLDLNFGGASPSSPIRSSNSVALGNDKLVERATGQDVLWQPITREWRKAGNEVFVPMVSGIIGKENSVFPALPPNSSTDDTSPVFTTFPLLENVFPNSTPSMAAFQNKLLLVYTRDHGAENPVQFTEIAFSSFDGTTWSAPQAVFPDVRGQFNPKAAFDGAGNAIVVFERIKDVGFTGADPASMGAQMEVVWTRRDAITGVWSEPLAMTDNGYLDASPRLAGPLGNGDLLLTWNQNESNELGGSGPPGAPTNNRVMTSRWRRTTQTWSSPEVLVSQMTGELSEDLAAGGTEGLYLWTVDSDGNTESLVDTEMYCRRYNSNTETWSSVTRLTEDVVPDQNARVVVDGSGQITVVWNRDGGLVMQKNLMGAVSLVRENTGGIGFADMTLTAGPSGKMVLLWQEASEHGSDARYRVYDPVSETWGKDALLTQDPDLERSFAPAWDSNGNLVMAYNNVETLFETKNVEVEGGGMVVVENVPQPGRVDLLITRKALITDLSVPAGGLTASNSKPLPGDTVTLTGRVKNSGDLAVQNVMVDFYDGDPNAGGKLLQTVEIPGWTEAAAEREVVCNWVVSEPASAHTIYMTAYPGTYVQEADTTNNTSSLKLNGTDLAVEFLSGKVERDGGARIAVKITNLSAPHAVPSHLRLKTFPAGTLLLQTDVPELAPGYSVDIPLRLPVGSHPEGDLRYEVTVDEEALNEDIDHGNNSALFSLNLLIDEDGDGIPRSWEIANGMSDSNPNDAHLDSDHDGFDAVMEYRAGTSPRDSRSRLYVGAFVPSPPESDGSRRLHITWPSNEGRLYRVERSIDLVHWQTVEQNIDATPPENILEDRVGGDSVKVFYRVVVQ